MTVVPSSANKTGPLTSARHAAEFGDTLAACMCKQLEQPYMPGLLSSTVCETAPSVYCFVQVWHYLSHQSTCTSQSTVEALGHEMKRREGFPCLVLEDEIAGTIQGLTGAGQGSNGSVKQVSHLISLYDGEGMRNTTISTWCCFHLSLGDRGSRETWKLQGCTGTSVALVFGQCFAFALLLTHPVLLPQTQTFNNTILLEFAKQSPIIGFFARAAGAPSIPPVLPVLKSTQWCQACHQHANNKQVPVFFMSRCTHNE